ncbi:unnamed protein product [Amoebophrya sp. A120]|nr:unnamed protein product [Amoebophrya sp. A120]|eukprot:GSA120T00011195001.1
MSEPKKGSALADLFKKKKKVAVKANNLNEGVTGAAPTVDALKKTASVDNKEWKEEEVKKDTDVSPKARIATNLATVKAEEAAANQQAKTWSDKPVDGKQQRAAGGAYQVPFNQPGQVTKTKFPELGTQKNQVQGKAKIETSKNRYGNLNVDDDSEAEEEKLSKPALVAKEKGAKMYKAPGAVADDNDKELDPSEKRALDEKTKKKLEKEQEKQRQKEEREAEKKAAEAKKAAEKAAAANKAVCDTSKFSYGVFDVNECIAKYTTRQKIVLAN